MGVEPYNFVSCLNCVLAQRLIRMLCPIVSVSIARGSGANRSGMRPEEYRDTPFYINVGCDACNHTGYRGRTRFTSYSIFLTISAR